MRNPSTAKSIAPKLYKFDTSYENRAGEFIEFYTAFSPDGVDELRRIAEQYCCHIGVAGMQVVLRHPKIEA